MNRKIRLQRSKPPSMNLTPEFVQKQVEEILNKVLQEVHMKELLDLTEMMAHRLAIYELVFSDISTSLLVSAQGKDPAKTKLNILVSNLQAALSHLTDDDQAAELLDHLKSISYRNGDTFDFSEILPAMTDPDGAVQGIPDLRGAAFEDNSGDWENPRRV